MRGRLVGSLFRTRLTSSLFPPCRLLPPIPHALHGRNVWKRGHIHRTETFHPIRLKSKKNMMGRGSAGSTSGSIGYVEYTKNSVSHVNRYKILSSEIIEALSPDRSQRDRILRDSTATRLLSIRALNISKSQNFGKPCKQTFTKFRVPK